MSVVAARVCNGKIVMAADSIVTRGDMKNTNGNFSKIIQENGMIIGSVGYAAEASLFWHFARTHRPDGSEERDILDYAIEFRKWKGDLEGNNEMYNTYLLAFDGHLFKIEESFVGEIYDYDAIGAGESYAYAALHLGHSAREAVKVACDLSCYVAEPIVEYEMSTM